MAAQPSHLAKLFSLFDRRGRWELAGLLAVMLVGAVLEMAGIALILPLAQMVMAPDKVSSLPVIGGLLSRLPPMEPATLTAMMGGVLLGFYVVKNLLLFAVGWTQFTLVDRRTAAVATDLFNRYLRRPYEDHAHLHSATALNNIVFTTLAAFTNGAVALLNFVLECLMTGAAAVALVLIEPRGTVVAMLVLGCAMGGTYLFTRNRIPAWSRRTKASTETMLRVVGESLAAVKELKVLGREGEMVGLFDRAAHERCVTHVATNMSGQAPRFIGEVAVLVAVMGLGIYLALIERRAVTEIVSTLGVFAAAALRILPSVNRLVSNASQMRQSVPLVDTLWRERLAVPEPAAVPAVAVPQQPALADGLGDIRVAAVSYTYRGAERAALDGVSLDIPAGATVALVGPSGSGKTTLVDLMLGLLTPTAGRITAGGVDIHAAGRAWQRHLGYVPQSIALIDASLRANVALGVPPEEVDDDRVRHALALAQLGELVASMPQGLDTVIGERGVRFSGGQRQRIGIARALYHDPAVLVLDEATSALDTLTEDEFTRAVEGLRGAKTIIIVAHRLSTVRRCDRLFLLRQGRLADQGSFDELYARDDEFRQMSQLSGIAAAGA